jgi:hypothetical protein
MTNRKQSYQGYVGIAEETTYGTGVAPTDYADIVSDGFSSDGGVSLLSTIRGRQTYKAERGEFDDSGGGDLPIDPEGVIGLLLKGAFGSASVSSSAPVGTHTFAVSDTLPSYSVEVGLADVDAVRHTGCVVDTLDFDHASGDRLTASVDLPAKEPKPQGSQQTPSYSSLRTLMYHDATFKFDGSEVSADVQSVTPSISNNVTLEARDEPTPTKVNIGQREVTADVTLDFNDMDMFKKFLGATGATGVEDTTYDASFNAKWESPETIDSSSTNYSLEWDMPRVKILTHDANLNEQDAIAENVELRAVHDDSSGYDAQATLVNGVTSAY